MNEEIEAHIERNQQIFNSMRATIQAKQEIWLRSFVLGMNDTLNLSLSDDEINEVVAALLPKIQGS